MVSEHLNRWQSAGFFRERQYRLTPRVRIVNSPFMWKFAMALLKRESLKVWSVMLVFPLADGFSISPIREVR